MQKLALMDVAIIGDHPPTLTLLAVACKHRDRRCSASALPVQALLPALLPALLAWCVADRVEFKESSDVNPEIVLLRCHSA